MMRIRVAGWYSLGNAPSKIDVWLGNHLLATFCVIGKKQESGNCSTLCRWIRSHDTRKLIGHEQLWAAAAGYRTANAKPFAMLLNFVFVVMLFCSPRPTLSGVNPKVARID